ncbi:hypothetical protein J1P26_19935 [Neobacillus sp. MM2021_6]|uniref:hypothetical protein n=1 Tax=Bacillaceae TaxID=186817 RepID=UPI001408C415|nr:MULTISPECIES: hypothetical protein [Bacillaceae]MBO0961979.1 hypothetical protein [Neobacillus sp. MM2021_6]NHC20324.1 hypothetical protein [Bacillus sp. MM2020_4]
MVRQKPKGYSQRQQDRHLERLKNKQMRQKKGTTVIRIEDRQAEHIADDFSQLIVEKKQMQSELRTQASLNNRLMKEKSLLAKRAKNMERKIYWLMIAVCVLLVIIASILE